MENDLILYGGVKESSRGVTQNLLNTGKGTGGYFAVVITTGGKLNGKRGSGVCRVRDIFNKDGFDAVLIKQCCIGGPFSVSD